MSTVALLRKNFTYEPETGHVRRKTPTRRTRAGAITGSYDSGGYLVTTLHGERFSCHFIAWCLAYGKEPPANKVVDHRNGVRDDNRKKNLRLLTFKQNVQNQKKRVNGTKSRFRGVTHRKRKNPWIARIRVNGKLLHIGAYGTEIAAASAWNEAALKYFGNHVSLNQVGESRKQE